MDILPPLFNQRDEGTGLDAQSSTQNQDASGDETQRGQQLIANSVSLVSGLQVGHCSDVGRLRERNEDSFYAMHSVLGHDYGEDLFGLFIVADGMGGHQRGEIASVTAARVCTAEILENVYRPYLLQDPQANSQPLQEVLTSAVSKANMVVQQEVPEGGSTLTLAVIMGSTAYLAHVGDSRAYFFRQGQLKQITQDHSLAGRLKELGQPSQDELKQAQSVLYKAIGQSDLELSDVDTGVQHLPPGASLLICSDGLWGLVDDETIAAVLAKAKTSQEACDRLIELANENGGHDNITAVLVSMGIAG